MDYGRHVTGTDIMHADHGHSKLGFHDAINVREAATISLVTWLDAADLAVDAIPVRRHINRMIRWAMFRNS